MKLFDDMTRIFIGPSNATEPHYCYLNRSARTDVGRARDLLEKWFENYPNTDDKKSLFDRFRVNKYEDNYHHNGAFFELYCQSLLLYQGYEVELHPAIEGELKTNPDFKVIQNKFPMFYLECKWMDDPNYKNSKIALDFIEDGINSIHSPNFYLHMSVEETSELTSPNVLMLRSFISKNLEELVKTDYDIDEFDWHLNKHSFTWQDSGWKLRFEPHPEPRHMRDIGEKQDIRLLGSSFHPPRFIDSSTPLYKKLRNKAHHYSKPELPFILAINTWDMFVNEIDIAEAMFGKEHVSFNVKTQESTLHRKPDGLWIKPSEPVRTWISAVLVSVSLGVGGIAKNTPVLWHNPWAEKPLNPDLWQGPQMLPNKKTFCMELRDGKKAWELFNLYPDWPDEQK